MHAENFARPVLRMKNKGGAPRGNRNALKHGRYTRQLLTARQLCKTYIRYCHAVAEEVLRELKEARPSPHRPNN
jgi:hypothetical protein